MGKGLLVMAVVVVVVFTVFWLRAGRPRPHPPRRPDPPPVVGPDDDPDFLRNLDRRPPQSTDEDPGHTPA